MTIRQFFCVHRHLMRERNDLGVLYLRCERCDYRVEAIHRTEDERDEMRETYRLPLPARAQKVAKRKRATVAAFRQAAR